MTNKDWLESFSEYLGDLMKEKQITQKDLAIASGLSESSISAYLNEQRYPTYRAIINIAYALDVSTDDLLDFGDNID